jgi:hypothetical protein
MWFFGGENVVLCVVDVVGKTAFFGTRKIRHVFQLYFLDVLFWDSVGLVGGCERQAPCYAPE